MCRDFKTYLITIRNFVIFFPHKSRKVYPLAEFIPTAFKLKLMVSVFSDLLSSVTAICPLMVEIKGFAHISKSPLSVSRRA